MNKSLFYNEAQDLLTYALNRRLDGDIPPIKAKLQEPLVNAIAAYIERVEAGRSMPDKHGYSSLHWKPLPPNKKVHDGLIPLLIDAYPALSEGPGASSVAHNICSKIEHRGKPAAVVAM